MLIADNYSEVVTKIAGLYAERLMSDVILVVGKQELAAHRLILTGTPIQNGVNELWALFDFLMPGYLGTEKQFIAKYSRPIINSRDAKSSGSEQEAGALAMESLHRQTLPFILR